MIGIYIHIPFCRRKCPYCDFYSVCADGKTIGEYVKALCRNIMFYKGRGIKADTVYFGGGTPSLLSAAQIGRVIGAVSECFSLSSPEITLEANPCTVDKQKLEGYRSAGVNRISFGVQSAEDEELKFLGRLHDFETAKRAVCTAAETGFENISCDIMLGLKGQTLEGLYSTADKLCSLPINHISAYMLKIEEGTPFDCDEVKDSVADEDLLCDMYLQTVAQLNDRGFMQYEISNFAKPGGESRHNLKYWHGEEYIGFGAAAHSFFEGKRFCCPADMKAFIADERQEKLVLEEAPDRVEEYIMLGLRLTEGISLEKIKAMGGEKLIGNIRRKAELFGKSGLCSFDGDRLRLTPAGFLASNAIIAEMLDV